MVKVVSRAGSCLVTNAFPGCVGPSSEKHCAKKARGVFWRLQEV